MAEATPGGPARMLVLGIGNPDRGDDDAGRAVARALRGALPSHIVLAEADGEATGLLAKLEQAQAAILIDACVSGAAPGAIHRFDAAQAPLPQASFNMSSHGFGLHEALELARALDQLPRPCVVYAIEGETFDAGAPLSPRVAAAVAQLAARLVGDLAQCEPEGAPIRA